MAPKLKWNTPVTKLPPGTLELISLEIFRYCRNVLKMKPRGGVYPSLVIFPRKYPNLYGQYIFYSHQIEIYPRRCKTLRRFVDTVIHEYVHSCQPWIKSRYSAQSQEFGYRKNPYEVEARRIAKEERTKCIRHLNSIFG